MQVNSVVYDKRFFEHYRWKLCSPLSWLYC